MSMRCSLRLQLFVRGYSLIELLVAFLITSIILAAIGGFLPNLKRHSKKVVTESHLNANLGSVFNYLSLDFRLAGENLPKHFPAVILSESPELLILRRSLSPYALSLCQTIPQNSIVEALVVADDNSELPGCSVSGNLTAFTSWREYVQTNLSFPFKVFVFNILTKNGFFTSISEFVHENDKLKLRFNNPRMFSQEITDLITTIYLIEELQFYRDNDTLKLLVANKDVEYTLAFNINRVDFKIQHNDTELDEFDTTKDWTQIDSITTTVEASDALFNRIRSEEYTFKFFPRNILSH